MPRKTTHKRPRAEEKKKKPAARARAAKTVSKRAALRESGLPGGGQGRSDRTGIIRGEVRVDPYITEGQPGYDESGHSEIIPQERLTGQEAPRGRPAESEGTKR